MLKMFRVPLLSLLITGLASINVQGSKNVHIFSALRGDTDLTRKCLDVRNSDFSNGTPVQTFACNPDSTAQSWTVDGFAIATELKVARTGENFCLDAIKVDSSNKVVLWKCNGNPQQQWNFTSINGPIFLVDNPGFCLDVPFSSFADGLQVETYPCSGGGTNQKWQAVGSD